MARNPIERIISEWIQRRSDTGDGVPSTVDAAVKELRDEFVGQSQYYYNIQPYKNLFPRDNIFIVFMEDLRADREAFFQKLCDFLSIEYTASQRGHVNPSEGKKLPNQLYTMLNRSPIVKFTKLLAPKTLKSAVKQMMMKDASSPDILLSPPVLKMVLESIESDSREILKYAGKPQDFWKLTRNQ